MPEIKSSPEEALQHIQSMKALLIDQKGNVPIPIGAFFVWAIISALLITLTPLILTQGDIQNQINIIPYTLVFLFGLLGLGGWILNRLILRENKKQERGWGSYQKLILKIGFFNLFFAALMTLIIGTFFHGILVNAIWMFVLGMTYMILGNFSRKVLIYYGVLLMSLSCIFAGFVYLYLLSGSTENNNFTLQLMNIHRIDTLLGLVSMSGGHLVLGFYFLQQKQKHV